MPLKMNQVLKFSIYIKGRKLTYTTPDHEPFMKWIALRDAVEIGKEYKYEEDQLFYHYTKDYSILKKNLD